MLTEDVFTIPAQGSPLCSDLAEVAIDGMRDGRLVVSDRLGIEVNEEVVRRYCI